MAFGTWVEVWDTFPICGSILYWQLFSILRSVVSFVSTAQRNISEVWELYSYWQKDEFRGQFETVFSRIIAMNHHRSLWALQIYGTGHELSLLEQALKPIRKWLATLITLLLPLPILDASWQSSCSSEGSMVEGVLEHLSVSPRTGELAGGVTVFPLHFHTVTNHDSDSVQFTIWPRKAILSYESALQFSVCTYNKWLGDWIFYSSFNCSEMCTSVKVC